MAEPEAGPVRRSEAQLRLRTEHLDVPQFGGQLGRQHGGAVGTVVVDHDDAGLRDGRPQPLDQLLEVLDLAVGRHHGHDAHGPGH